MSVLKVHPCLMSIKNRPQINVTVLTFKRLASLIFVVQVPKGMKVRVTFTMFRMKEPGVDIRVCHKDYVEIMGKK